MKLAVFVSLAVLGLVASSVSARKNWALLIAGSGSYGNYRHQADICHAYQIMHKAGIPDEQIVVMMVDDIAHNPENPFQGNIINHINGTNVYPGVLKDYTGKDVNTETFLAVLQGKKERVRQLLGREGKVIDSGPDDYVFVNFADHGGPGVLCMPDECSSCTAQKINEALQSMHDNKKYAKLTFYVEACESGSIFADLLPKDINVYATTAANPQESSWGCYWDASREAYLGDTYSVKWMEDTDVADLTTETFQQQYETVKKETTKSHVQQYGDLSMAEETLNKFFGNNQQRDPNAYRSIAPITDQVPSEMVPLMTLKKRVELATPGTQKHTTLTKQLKDLEKQMSHSSDLMMNIIRGVYSDIQNENILFDKVLKVKEKINNWACYQPALKTLENVCPGMKLSNNDFMLRRLFALVNLCNQRPGKVIQAIEAAATVNPMC